METSPGIFSLSLSLSLSLSGVGDYTSLNRPDYVLIIGIKAPYPPKGPYDSLSLSLFRAWELLFFWESNKLRVKCRNLIKKPWAYNPKMVGFKKGTLIKAQGFLIRFLH